MITETYSQVQALRLFDFAILNFEWREIPGFEGEYEVSSLGSVRSMDRIDRGGNHRKSRVLRDETHVKGYRQVLLATDEGPRMYRVHILVALAFIGPRPSPTHQVNHIDGIKDHNIPGNLEWVTPSENVQHALRVLGRQLGHKGEAHSHAVLTDAQVIEARRRYRPGRYGQVTQLAREMGVSYKALWNAIRGRTWKHLL